MMAVAARRRTVYLLIALNLLMLAGLGVLIGYGVELRSNLNGAVAEVAKLETRATALASNAKQQQQSLYTGCVKRSNPQRLVNVFILEQAVLDAEIVVASGANSAVVERFRRKLPVLERKLRSLEVDADAFPHPKNPYLVDCEAAFLGR